MAITDILLRITTNPDLVTKGSVLTNVEGDANMIEVYTALKELKAMFDGNTIEVDGIPININDLSGTEKWRMSYDSSTGEYRISQYDGVSAYDTILSIDTDGYIMNKENTRLAVIGNQISIEQYDIVNEVWEVANCVNIGDLVDRIRKRNVKYGYLYNWYAATNVAEITSSATWGVPSDDDWATLVTELGTAATVGGLLKEKGTIHWKSPNTGATNAVNFSAVAGGGRYLNGVFYNTTENGGYLSITEYDRSEIYIRYMDDGDAVLYRDHYDKEYGFSLRLVRDATVTEQTYSDGTFCDVYTGNDGRQYRTVKIGTQVWMAENLAETKYRDGTAIPNITDATTWAADSTGARCAYDNNEANAFDFINNGTYSVRSVEEATYDVEETDCILNVTYPTTAAVTSLTLPTAECYRGRVIIIKDASGNANTNNITVDTEGSETIDGANTYTINANYGVLRLYSDGENWFII